MKKLLLLILSSFLLLSKDGPRQEQILPQAHQDAREIATMDISQVENYPLKTAAYWTSPIMGKSDAINLARHDILIVDLENKFNNRRLLLMIKKMNPEIKILAYSNPMEIFTTLYSNRPWQNKVINEITKNKAKWILKSIENDNGVLKEKYTNFWPGMLMLNMSVECPKVNGKRYYQWMSEKITTEILSDPIFDGYFQDNGTTNISWVEAKGNVKIDIDGDMQAEKDSYVDRKWGDGMNEYLAEIRDYGLERSFELKDDFPGKKDFIIITNKGDLNLLNTVDGKFFEKFPNNYLGETWANGWRQSISNARKTGPYTILQVERGSLEFGISSALLLDNAYLAIGQDDAGYYPELNLNVGYPTGKLKTEGTTFTREYQKAKVAVEPLQEKGSVNIK